MKIGDLVTLSATGLNLHQNNIVRCAKFGMIMKIYGPDYSSVFRINWYMPRDTKVGARRTSLGMIRNQQHRRYEIKKLKKNT